MWSFILLRKLQLQTKMREKPPNGVENRIMGCGGRGKFPSLAENVAEMRRWTAFGDIYVPDDRNSRNQVLGLVTSQATKNQLFW